MKKSFFTFALFVLCHLLQAQIDTTQQINTSRSNTPLQQKKAYVILISVDGMRYDYLQKHHASNLQRLSQKGVRATYMLPSFPSLTFPNHYSLATGLYPSHHGLVDNTFYDAQRQGVYNMNDKKKAEDGRWYGGTPLWVLAEQQGMLTASFYWVGSDADVQGVRPTYYYHYNEKIGMDSRINAVKHWLTLPEASRPHLITFYFPEVDHQGHDFGPDASETEAAVQLIDRSVARMASITDSLKLPVTYILVSDHGMTQVDTAHPLPIPAILRDTTLCRLTAGSSMLHVYLKDPGSKTAIYDQLKKEVLDADVYYPDETPASWHYRKADDRLNRIGDMILVARNNKVFKTSSRPVTPGKHGYPPETADMRATFLAWGFGIKSAGEIAPFENVHVYPLVAGLLKLDIKEKIDGQAKVLKPVMK